MACSFFQNVLIGFGSATQTHCAAIGGELLPNKHRYLYFGAVTFFLMPLSAIAPAIGKPSYHLSTAFVLLLTWSFFLPPSALNACYHTPSGWRTIYYILTGLTIGALALFFFCYHPPKFEQLHTRHSKKQFIRTLDYFGLFLFCGGIVPFLLGISWGGQRYREYLPTDHL